MVVCSKNGLQQRLDLIPFRRGRWCCNNCGLTTNNNNNNGLHWVWVACDCKRNSHVFFGWSPRSRASYEEALQDALEFLEHYKREKTAAANHCYKLVLDIPYTTTHPSSPSSSVYRLDFVDRLALFQPLETSPITSPTFRWTWVCTENDTPQYHVLKKNATECDSFEEAYTDAIAFLDQCQEEQDDKTYRLAIQMSHPTLF